MTFLLPDPDDTWDEAFISAAFVSWHTEPSEDGSYIPMTEQEAQDTFQRWLNEERAKAWDRAIDFFEINIYGEATSAKEYNPYRKADQ